MIQYAITISNYTALKIDQIEEDYVHGIYDKSKCTKLIKKVLHKEIDSNAVDSQSRLIVIYNGKQR